LAQVVALPSNGKSECWGQQWAENGMNTSEWEWKLIVYYGKSLWF